MYSELLTAKEIGTGSWEIHRTRSCARFVAEALLRMYGMESSWPSGTDLFQIYRSWTIGIKAMGCVHVGGRRKNAIGSKNDQFE